MPQRLRRAALLNIAKHDLHAGPSKRSGYAVQYLMPRRSRTPSFQLGLSLALFHTSFSYPYPEPSFPGNTAA